MRITLPTLFELFVGDARAVAIASYLDLGHNEEVRGSVGCKVELGEQVVDGSG